MTPAISWRMPDDISGDAVDQWLRERSTVNQDTGCWQWLGAINSDGTARVRYRGKMRRAAHAIIAAKDGHQNPLQAIPACGNPGCVNPQHMDVRTYNPDVRLYEVKQ